MTSRRLRGPCGSGTHQSASRVLAPSLAVSADAALSPDARTALIAAREKAGQPWQIWEVPLAGGTPRQLTSGADDCIRPLYGAEQKFVYARRTSRGFQIEIAPLSGGSALRPTYLPGNFLPNAVLRDPAGEHFPDDAAHCRYRREYNTRPALRLIRPLAGTN